MHDALSGVPVGADSFSTESVPGGHNPCRARPQVADCGWTRRWGEDMGLRLGGPLRIITRGHQLETTQHLVPRSESWKYNFPRTKCQMLVKVLKS